MDLIPSANALISMALTATPQERLRKIGQLSISDEDGNRPKSAIKRLNKLLMGILKARDEIAVELQEEPWQNVDQLGLFDERPGRMAKTVTV